MKFAAAHRIGLGSQIDRVTAVGLWVLLIVSLLAIEREQLRWFLPFVRDFRIWVTAPELSLSEAAVPVGMATAAIVLFAFVSLGWLAAGIAVADTEFEQLFGF